MTRTLPISRLVRFSVIATEILRVFFRALNRFGIPSAIDAGGGFQKYPDDYGVVNELHRNGELSIRLAYNLFTQRPKQELADFQSWTKMTRPGDGDDFYRVNGAGEMLVFSAADFEDILVPRPDMLPVMESELKAVIRHLVENRWPVGSLYEDRGSGFPDRGLAIWYITEFYDEGPFSFNRGRMTIAMNGPAGSRQRSE